MLDEYYLDTIEELDDDESLLTLWYKYLTPEQPLNFEI